MERTEESSPGAILSIGDMVTWVYVDGRGEGLGQVVEIGDSTVTIKHGLGRTTIPRTHVVHRF